MPVLIQIPWPGGTNSSFGTGFYLAESNKAFLVTAGHVIFDMGATNSGTLINSNATVMSCARGAADSKSALALDLKRLKETGRLKGHPNRDIAIIQIAVTSDKADGSTVISPVDGVAWLSPLPFVAWDPYSSCKPFEQVLDGSEVYVLGYPVSLIIGASYHDIDPSEPLARRGIISQRNRRTRRFIIDSAVYHGNSGGPAVIVEHPTVGVELYKIAGIAIKYVPVITDIDPGIGVTNKAFANSGYGVVEPIDYALELMRQ